MDEIIERLRKVNEQVPNPPRLPSDKEISQVESILNIEFHPDYRKYLKEASDVVFGALEPLVVVYENDYNFLPTVSREAWKFGLPKDLLPICEDNGDYFAIDNSGVVHYWSHNGLTHENWPNLATWIEEVWLNQ